MATNDEYYVDRCLDGHPDDYRHLVQRYHPVLMAHLVGQLGSAELAEEAVQETFVRSYFNLSKLRDRRSFFAWLMGMSNRVALEQQRQRQRDRRAIDQLAQRPVPESRTHDYSLAKTIAKLPDFHRELILLRYYGGCSCKDIAEQVGLPLGTITKTLSRAYAQLRQLLSDPNLQQNCEV